MNHSQPNIVIIKTDQQRADTIAALGYPHMHTPNMDRLVREGVSMTDAHCCSATCVPSRAAFYTGQFAHNTGVYGFDDWAHRKTWLHALKAAGYRTSAIGKVHHQPSPDYMAFDERVYAENFPEFIDYDDYSNYLKAEGQPHPCELMTTDGKWLDKLCSASFPLDEKYFVDNWVGRMAKRWIEDYESEQPFFLHVGFVGPHDPFSAPERFIDLYRDADIPEPIASVDAYDGKPPQYKRFMEQCINPDRFEQAPAYGVFNVRIDDKSPEELLEMRRHYYARISAIDEQVGFLLDVLERRDLLDNTLIVLTSDHGENLGDHRMMYKWLMTDQATRVPMVIRPPGGSTNSRMDERLFSQIDIGPTLLDFAGVEASCSLDGLSNRKRIEEPEAEENVPDIVFCEDNYLIMAKTREDKLVHYIGQPYGEYYDLKQDPGELTNLFDTPEYQTRITELKLMIFDWMSRSRYLGSAEEVGLGAKPKRYWPEYTPEDPYILSGGSRPLRTKIYESTLELSKR